MLLPHRARGLAWSRLRGKRVLVDHGGQPLAMFKYACHKQGRSSPSRARRCCWTPHVEITRPAFEAAVDVFQHAKLITKRHRYEDVVALEPPAA